MLQAMRSSARALAAAAIVALAIAAGAAPARAGNGVALLRYVPDDAQVVSGLDVASARDSALFRTWVDKFLTSAGSGEYLRAIGIDPLADIDTILVARHGFGDSDGEDGAPDVAIFEGRVGKAALDKMGGTVEVKRRGKLTYWVNDKGVVVRVGKRLFVAPIARVDQLLDLVAGKGPSAARSPKAAPLRAAIAATDTRHDGWLALVLPADAKAKAAAAGVDADAVAVCATVGRSLTLEIRGLMASEKAAADALALANSHLQEAVEGLGHLGLKDAARSISISADGSIVEATVTVTEAELGTLGGLAGGLGSP